VHDTPDESKGGRIAKAGRIGLTALVSPVTTFSFLTPSCWFDVFECSFLCRWQRQPSHEPARSAPLSSPLASAVSAYRPLLILPRRVVLHRRCDIAHLPSLCGNRSDGLDGLDGMLAACHILPRPQVCRTGKREQGGDAGAPSSMAMKAAVSIRTAHLHTAVNTGKQSCLCLVGGIPASRRNCTLRTNARP
jgi:hypothetical protein